MKNDNRKKNEKNFTLLFNNIIIKMAISYKLKRKYNDTETVTVKRKKAFTRANDDDRYVHQEFTSSKDTKMKSKLSKTKSQP